MSYSMLWMFWCFVFQIKYDIHISEEMAHNAGYVSSEAERNQCMEMLVIAALSYLGQQNSQHKPIYINRQRFRWASIDFERAEYNQILDQRIQWSKYSLYQSKEPFQPFINPFTRRSCFAEIRKNRIAFLVYENVGGFKCPAKFFLALRNAHPSHLRTIGSFMSLFRKVSDRARVEAMNMVCFSENIPPLHMFSN